MILSKAGWDKVAALEVSKSSCAWNWGRREATLVTKEALTSESRKRSEHPGTEVHNREMLRPNFWITSTKLFICFALLAGRWKSIKIPLRVLGSIIKGKQTLLRVLSSIIEGKRVRKRVGFLTSQQAPQLKKEPPHPGKYSPTVIWSLVTRVVLRTRHHRHHVRQWEASVLVKQLAVCGPGEKATMWPPQSRKSI